MLIRRSLWCFSLLHLFVSQLCAQEGPSFSRTQEVSEVVVNNGNQAALGQLLLRAIEVESAVIVSTCWFIYTTCIIGTHDRIF